MSEQTQAIMWYTVKKYLDGELNNDRWKYTFNNHELYQFFEAYQVIDGEVLNDIKFGFFVSELSVVCYSDFQLEAPEKCKCKVAEYIIRANEHDLHGAFDMVYDDGRIRYKTVLSIHDLKDDITARASLSNACFTSMLAWQKHFENLFCLIHSKIENKNIAQMIDGVLEGRNDV